MGDPCKDRCAELFDVPVGPDWEVADSELNSWQTIVDLIAHVGGTRAGLIMRVERDSIRPLVVSRTPNNPYVVGASEPWVGSGLYCEKVIRENKVLAVPNALRSKEWNHNPDLKLGMVSYLGFPIRLPDGGPFGTICILDDKGNRFSHSVMTLMEKMRDLIEAHLTLLHISSYEPLTGLLNRAVFDRYVMQQMQKAREESVPMSLLMLDIDYFKTINDHFGHKAGDEVLHHLARTLTDSLCGKGLAARYGGDEFIVFLPGMAIEQSVQEAERIRERMETGNWVPDQCVTVSIGAAEHVPGETYDDWFRRTDNALYKAKNSGRNLVMAYSELDAVPYSFVSLEWDNQWNSGNAQIDREHREMLEMGNRLINQSLVLHDHAKVVAMLERLLRHIVFHFDHEEAILTQIGYPECARHGELHQDLIAKSLRLKEEYARGVSKQSAFFSFLLDDVIVGHLEQEDSKYFPYTKRYPDIR